MKKFLKFPFKILLSLTATTNDKLSGENSTSSSSSVIIASNYDLLTQILLYLPLKSLGVSQLVSKEWFSVISDPYFLRNYHLRNRLSIRGLFSRKPLLGSNPEYLFISLDENITSGHVPFKTLNFVEDPLGITIQQSCNGLLCCRTYCRSFKSNVSKSTYYICNPFTQHYRILPPSQFRENACVSHCIVSLAFDPMKSPYYVAICIWRDDKHNFQIEIYSSKTDSWRLSGGAFRAPMGLYSKSGVYWNGSLHWINLDRTTAVYFDINRELIRNMPLPSVPHGYIRNGGKLAYFGECRGHLQLIETYGPNPTQFDIMEMENDYTGWNKKYHVNLELLLTAYTNIVRDRFEFSILLVEEEEKDGSSKLVLQILNNMVIICYDFKEMSFKKIHDVLPARDGEVTIRMKYNYGSTYQYAETLASV